MSSYFRSPTIPYQCFIGFIDWLIKLIRNLYWFIGIGFKIPSKRRRSLLWIQAEFLNQHTKVMISHEYYSLNYSAYYLSDSVKCIATQNGWQQLSRLIVWVSPPILGWLLNLFLYLRHPYSSSRIWIDFCVNFIDWNTLFSRDIFSFQISDHLEHQCFDEVSSFLIHTGTFKI